MSSSDALALGMGGIMIVVWILAFIISFAMIALTIVCLYKIYQKAGYEGWKAIIPYYNSYILSEFTLGNGFYFFIMFVPVIGFILQYVMFYRLALCFGKGLGFAFGLILVPYVFLPILAFEKQNTYRTLEPIF